MCSIPKALQTPPAPVKGTKITALCPTAWPHTPHVLTKLMANIPMVAVAKMAHCSVAHSFQKKPRTQAHLQEDEGAVRNQSCVAPQAASAWGGGQLLAGVTLWGWRSRLALASLVYGEDGGWEQLQPRWLCPARALQKQPQTLSLCHPHPMPTV